MVVEATHLIGSRMNPSVEAAFLRGLRAVRVEAPKPEELDRMAELE